MIVDLSAPDGVSVNDGIGADVCSLTYASVDNAVSIIQHLGQGTQLVIVDLKDAYHIIPVHPQDLQLLGIQLNNQVFVDRSLPFGLQSAPKVFTAFADLVARAITAGGCAGSCTTSMTSFCLEHQVPWRWRLQLYWP